MYVYSVHAYCSTGLIVKISERKNPQDVSFTEMVANKYYVTQRKNLDDMIFPAYVQGGKPQSYSTETDNLDLPMI